VILRAKYLHDRTTTQQLQAEASIMEVHARELRLSHIADYGTVRGRNADDLIEALMRIPEVLGPSIASVYERAAKVGAGGKGQQIEMRWLASRIEQVEWEGIILSDDAKVVMPEGPTSTEPLSPVKQRIKDKLEAKNKH